MPLFEVIYRIPGTTNLRAIVDIDMGAEEARGFTEQSLSENLFPAGVKALVGASVMKDVTQDKIQWRVFASVALLVEADTAQHAAALEPPIDLLTKVIDGFLGESAGRLVIWPTSGYPGEGWKVIEVTPEDAAVSA